MLHDDRQYGSVNQCLQPTRPDNYAPSVYIVQANHGLRDYIERLGREKCPCSQKLPLTNYDAIPFYLKGNCWVERGYRVNYSAKHCIFRLVFLNQIFLSTQCDEERHQYKDIRF